MQSLFVDAKNFIKEILQSENSRIRNRLLAIGILLFLIITLIGFDIQQGFSSWENVHSQLGMFIATNVNIVMLVLMFYLVLKNILKLASESRQKVIGVNLKTKLIIAFLLLSLPATAFHLFTSSFITSTLETWLAGQHESVIYNAKRVADAYHQNLKSLMELRGWIVEFNFKNDPELLKHVSNLDTLLAQEVGEGIMIYRNDHQVLYQTLRTNAAQKYWSLPTKAEWQQIDAKPTVWLVEELENRFIYRHLRNIQVGKQHVILEIFYPATKNVSSAINDIDAQEQSTRIFSESQDLLKRYTVIILAFVTMVIVFAATWLAFYLARGFIDPIEKLAIATELVAQGNLGYQVDNEQMSLDKDFALLVQSFNDMSRQLLENHLALEKTTQHLQESHRTLEEHTRFVELVLENIKTGVISLDMQGIISGLNRSAKTLLLLENINYIGKPYQTVLTQQPLLHMFDTMYLTFQSSQRKWLSQNITLMTDDMPKNIAVTMLVLENVAKEAVGVISVFENISEIQRLQRAIAWREVARRIAHEIKNPLTPIQLSAQRIRHKYAKQVEEEEALNQATQTIIDEVEQLKRMVSEFSKFARLPESNLQLEDLNAVINESTLLYQNALPARIQLSVALDQQVPPLLLDREQFKRALTNLIDNAAAAIPKKGKIIIESHYDQDLKIVRIAVIDTGTGVSPKILARIFEPYATTKTHGTGLGLTIVSQIISDHNGFIRHQAPDSGGSCFSIELPVPHRV